MKEFQNSSIPNSENKLNNPKLAFGKQSHYYQKTLTKTTTFHFFQESEKDPKFKHTLIQA
jgi:hypothetical protein